MCILLVEIVLGNRSNSTKPDKIKIKLGFVVPLDNRLAATATLGREMDSLFRLAIESINNRARKEGSIIELEADFSSKNIYLLVYLFVCVLFTYGSTFLCFQVRSKTVDITINTNVVRLPNSL